MACFCKILGHLVLLIMKKNPFEIAAKNTLPASPCEVQSLDSIFSVLSYTESFASVICDYRKS